MEPVKLLNENNLPSEFWNRAYEMGRILIGDNVGEMAQLGITLSEMRMRADDHRCLSHQGSILFIKEGKEKGDWVITRHILRITEESGKTTFTVEIFADHSDTELMFQEFGVARENVRETVFREAGKIRDMFFAV